MTSFSEFNHVVSPLTYFENPNIFCVVDVFQFVEKYGVNVIAGVEKLQNYFELDFDINFKQHIKENDLKEGYDEIDEIIEFWSDNYPYCYFFVELHYLELSFRDKNIFITELIDLLDIKEEEKHDILSNINEKNCILVKLRSRLRNLITNPIPSISELKLISAKINFDEMYDEYLEY
ncbi:MAG: hypothetical protein JEZ03_17180 [Bacteroidales bacterium]|nr:hypothetical protein [Bacteroidales bacterium]